MGFLELRPQCGVSDEVRRGAQGASRVAPGKSGKLRQKEKDKYHAMSLICEVQNMTRINLFTQQRQTHRDRLTDMETNLWLPKGKEVEEG